MPTLFDALLFDLDGTLIDSMPLHERAWAQWFACIGEPLGDDPHFFAATAGRSIDEILADRYPRKSGAERAAMAENREAMYRALARQHLQTVAGALPLLARARAQGLKLAVCTAAPPANIAVAFERFGLGALVDAVTSPADGLRGKPHPDIFEEAARRLGIAPERCLVFEDAPLGLEAARRAGMAAVALTTTLGADAFSAYPNLITAVRDFNALDTTLLFA
jgi:HAD superfamily hydrolase (TIGR01509 family)